MAVAAGSAALLAAGRSTAAAARRVYTLAEARQDVEYLRKWYGIATDMLGVKNDPEGNKREGRRIYQKIFTPDAKIYLLPYPLPPGSAPTRVGPDAWAEFVENALKATIGSQHLLGTQVAEIDEMPEGIPGQGRSSKGHATCISYLNSWNVSQVDGQNRLVTTISTYRDKARVTPGIGWQIYEMHLSRVSGETRIVA
jgi:hypothetical protein